MLFKVEQAFVGRDEKQADPLKTPAWEATQPLEQRILFEAIHCIILLISLL